MGVFDALLRHFEEGGSPEDFLRDHQPRAERELMWRCAAVRQFDPEIMEDLIRPRVKAEGVDTVEFERLVSGPNVERVPRRRGTYRLRDSARRRLIAEWIDDGPALEPSPELPRMSKSFYEFSVDALEYYKERSELDALYHEIACDQRGAAERFENHYRQADEGFNLGACADLLKILDERADLLRGRLADIRQEYRAYRNSRLLWASEFYDTIVYLDRAEPAAELELLINAGDDSPWILDLHAPGGSGKTMFVRWALSRYLTPLRVPCVRIDFDIKDARRACDEPWLILLELAFQLNEQLPGHPFGELLSRYEAFRVRLDRFGVGSDELRGFDPDTLAHEIPLGFRHALASQTRIDRVVIIFDTTEELLLYHPHHVATIVGTIGEMREPEAPRLHLLLSGRYALSEHLDPESWESFHNRFGRPADVFVPQFSESEAREYMVGLRHVPDDERAKTAIEKSNGNPFKLALYADLIRTRPKISAGEIASYPDADLAYLIERVVERIEDPQVRWVLRYGTIPRLLTRTFLRDVMADPLLRAMSNRSTVDRPDRDELPNRSKEGPTWSTRLIEPHESLDLDELWSKLESYAAKFSWISRSKTDPDTLVFHATEVRPPMRCLLREKQPAAYAELQELAAQYFERQAESEPQNWGQWMLEAWLHRNEQRQPETNQRRGGEFLESYLNMAEERGEEESIVALCDGVLENLPPAEDDTRQDVTDLIVLRCRFESTIMPRARSIEISGSTARSVSAARKSLKALQELRAESTELIAPQPRWQLAESRLLAGSGQFDAALKTLEQALDAWTADQRLRERRRAALLITQGEVLSAVGRGSEAVDVWNRVLRHFVSESRDSRAAIRRLVANEHRRLRQFERESEVFREGLDEASEQSDSLHIVEFRRSLVESRVRCARFSEATSLAAQQHHESTGGSRFAMEVERVRWSGTAGRMWLASRDAFQAAEVAEEGNRRASGLSNLSSLNEFDSALVSRLNADAQQQLALVLAELMEFQRALVHLDRARSQFASAGAHRESIDAALNSAMVCLDHVGDLTEARRTLDSIVNPAHDQSVCCDLMQRRLDLLQSGRRTAKYALLCIANRIAFESDAEAGSQIAGPSTVREQVARLLEFLSAVEPATARLFYLQPLRHWPSHSQIPAELRRQLVDVALPASEFELGSGRILDDEVAIAVPIIDVMNVGQRPEVAKLVLANALERQFESRNLFAIRELLEAADRLRVFPDVKDEQALLSFRHPATSYRTFAAVLLYQHARRCFEHNLIEQARSAAADAMGMFSSISKESRWHAQAELLCAELFGDSGPENTQPLREKAQETLERLGWPKVPEQVKTKDEFESLHGILRQVLPEREARSRHDRIELRSAEGRIVLYAEGQGQIDLPMRGDEDEIELSAEPDPTADAVHVLSNPPPQFRLSVVSEEGAEAVWRIRADLRPACLLERIADLEQGSLLWRAAHGELARDSASAFAEFFRNDWAALGAELTRGLLPPDEIDLLKLDWGDSEPKDLRLEFSNPRMMALPWEFMTAGHDGTARPLSEVTPIRGVYRARLNSSRTYPPSQEGTAIIMHPSYDRLSNIERGMIRPAEKLTSAYYSAGFDMVSNLVNPTVGSVFDELKIRHVSVIHVVALFNESPSLGVYLDFGPAFESSGTDTADASSDHLTSLAFNRMIESLGALVILDAVRPYSLYEAAQQLLWRNTFAADVFGQSSVPAVLATGLWDEYQHDTLSFELPRLIGSGESFGEIARFIQQSGRSGRESRELETMIGSLGTALFADDPLRGVEPTGKSP